MNTVSRIFALVAAMALTATGVVAQKPPGQQSSPNMKLIAHLPLGDTLEVADIEVEQEMSRPYAYVSKSLDQIGFDIIDLRDISNPKKIWWDVRPHPHFPTLEFRVCDIPTRVDDTVAIAALFQAIVCKLDRLIERNLGFRLYRRMLIQENKWRAIRYGLEGKLIDFGQERELPEHDLILEYLAWVDDVLDELAKVIPISEQKKRSIRQEAQSRAVVNDLLLVA